MKIALGQINTATGDVAYNVGKMIRVIEQARSSAVDVVVFPELALSGYPPKDFVHQHGWVQEQEKWLANLTEASKGLHIILGAMIMEGPWAFNVAIWIDRDGKQVVQKKILLPTEDVFDERRYFIKGRKQEVWVLDDMRVGVSICEDLWAPNSDQYKVDPIDELAKQNPDVMINISASPFVAGKIDIRKKLIQTHIEKHACPFVYMNLVGGNDELIFDGASFVTDGNGNLKASAKSFEEDFLVWDTDTSGVTQDYPKDLLVQKRDAITVGLRDFFYKNKFSKAVLGLSGGVDSAVVAALAARALGPENLTCVFMPTEYTRSISQEDASLIASSLGARYIEIPMNDLKNATNASLSAATGSSLKSITMENLQARIRGNLLMSVSSELDALVLQTGNKSEIALGYCTLYGDMVGAVSPIGDLYKNEVYAMGRLLNQDVSSIPDRVFDRAPSAELKEDQEDTDALPPYDVVDEVVRLLIEECQSQEEVVAKGYKVEDVKKLARLIDVYEFKRNQSAPILKVSKKAFGTGRRMPIARSGYEA